MISKASCYVAGVIVAALAIAPTEASTINVLLGNDSPPFANGAITTSAIALGAQTPGSGAFSGACGSDANTNCSRSWTFNYAVPAGETVTAGTLTLGVVDIDSKAAGTQVNTYSVTGGDNLTAPLNAAAELVQSLNNQYDVFTVSLTSLGIFNSGTATINLTLQGPGQAALATNFNGSILMFSRLSLTTSSGTVDPNLPAVPEPASLTLLATGLGILVRARAKKRRPVAAP
jgi:hypothetical protein